ncbi:MAG: peptidoglycan-binding protein [Candidatus Omnitrophota bacterium]|nr:peptidoglycan-binding protein [Candidatus Omnitrophota bacterium]
MKRLLIILGIGATVLWLVGPLHEGIGEFFQRAMSASPERQTSKSAFPPPLADVQLALQEAGFHPGPIDGRMGRRTRNALNAFQSANNLKPTGEVNAQTWEALQTRSRTRVMPEAQATQRLASSAMPGIAPPPGRTSAAPEIPEATEADETSPSAGQKDEVRAVIMEYRLRSPDRIKKVQLALKEAGFDPGPIDGEPGPRTDQALLAFQKAQGLEPDGIVGVKTWTALSEYLEPGSLRFQERVALQD